MSIISPKDSADTGRAGLDVEEARRNMIEHQLRPWEVLDRRVTEVLARVPREAFVPPSHRGHAFADLQMPLGLHDQVMMEPKLEGRMLQALDPQPNDRVLEIGTGSGFITACLIELGGPVTSVEYFPELQEQALTRLESLGYMDRSGRHRLMTGDASAGWDDAQQYDVIAVTGSLPELHHGFHHSLRVGGRVFVIVGDFPIMEALLITRTDTDAWRTESVLDTSVPHLINARKHRRFAI